MEGGMQELPRKVIACRTCRSIYYQMFTCVIFLHSGSSKWLLQNSYDDDQKSIRREQDRNI